MFFAVICFSLLVILLSVGASKMKPWESGIHMINAEWLDDSEKFSLISRWGRLD